MAFYWNERENRWQFTNTITPDSPNAIEWEAQFSDLFFNCQIKWHNFIPTFLRLSTPRNVRRKNKHHSPFLIIAIWILFSKHLHMRLLKNMHKSWKKLLVASLGQRNTVYLFLEFRMKLRRPRIFVLSSAQFKMSFRNFRRCTTTQCDEHIWFDNDIFDGKTFKYLTFFLDQHTTVRMDD